MDNGILSTPEFQMSLLLFVSLAGYLIAYRINQSAVVGIILAGILIGPSFLGLVTYTNFVSSLGHLGAVVLLFTVGLHFKIEEITRLKYFIIALLGIIVPWLAGFFTSELFGFDFAASIFIGTALTATSIAITANVLKEMNKLETKVARVIIGAAIIDDVLGLLALSFSEEIVTGTLSWQFLVLTILKALAFILIGVILGKSIINKIMLKMDKTHMVGKYPEIIFIFAMMVAFLYSMTAELVGLSAIVGSFLAGVSLAEVRVVNGKAFREGAEYLQIIFASIFFVSLGVLLDFHSITTDILVFILVITVIAIISKIIACGLPARLVGLNVRESLAVGVGMVPRGEVAMIVALIGLSRNLIEPDVYATLVLMSLISTILPPLVLRNFLLKTARG